MSKHPVSLSQKAVTPDTNLVHLSPAVTNAPFKIGIGLHRISPFTVQVTWDTSRYHYDYTRTKVELVLRNIVFRSAKTLAVVSIDLQHGSIVFDDSARHQLVKTDSVQPDPAAEERSFEAGVTRPGSSHFGLRTPEQIGPTETHEIAAVSSAPYGLEHAKTELTNLLYNCCMENPAANRHAYFSAFSEAETA